VGGQDSVTATLTSALSNTSAAAPSGTIQFYDSLNGATAVALANPQAINAGNGNTLVVTLAPMLVAGTHVISATYSGDGNWNSIASVASVKIISTTADFSLAGPSALTITAGQSGTVALSTASILGFSTPVAVSCGGTLPEGVSCGTATIAPGAAGSITLTSVASGTIATTSILPDSARPWAVPGVVAMAGVLFLCLPRRRRFASLATLLFMVSVGFAMSGCAGGNTLTASQVVVTSANTKVASGTGGVLNAMVSGSTNRTGTVTFYDAGTAIGTSTLIAGIGQLSISTLSVGTHAVTASYSGDNNNSASTSSDTLEQTITGTFNVIVVATAGSSSHSIVVPVTLN
jgi:hypothetical protein